MGRKKNRNFDFRYYVPTTFLYTLGMPGTPETAPFRRFGGPKVVLMAGPMCDRGYAGGGGQNERRMFVEKIHIRFFHQNIENFDFIFCQHDVPGHSGVPARTPAAPTHAHKLPTMFLGRDRKLL